MAQEEDDSEKTEDPTEQRIEDFRKKGEVASSKELISVLVLSGTLTVIIMSSFYVYELFGEYITWLYKIEPSKLMDAKFLQDIFKRTAILMFKSTAPILLTSLAIGVIGQISQIGLLYAPEVLELKFDRINPIAGVKRLFSKKAFVEAFKGLFKFAIVISITYSVIKEKLMSFTGYLHTEPTEALAQWQLIVMELGFSILFGLFIVALGDFAWEKYSYSQKLKMTKQQAKDDNKQKEGNPEIKQRIRNIQREMARNRMMADIPKADVIVTNPTHISIALKYDPETMIAPEIVAKGSDHIAMKIREIAKDNKIPIVENVPLARGLYKTVKIGQGIPRTFYKAIAEVLAFVYKLKRKKQA